MPVDSATRSVEVTAPVADVLAVLRDVEAQPVWIPEILEAELLEVYEDTGCRPPPGSRRPRPSGRTSYTLSYEHGDAGLCWTMVEGRLQTGQEGSYTLERLGPVRGPG